MLERARLIEHSSRLDSDIREGPVQSESETDMGLARSESDKDKRAIRRIERQIGALRDSRIVRSLDFVGDGDVWSMEAPDIGPYIPPRTVLLEFFRVGDSFVGFAITRDGASSVRLDMDERKVRELLRALNFNFMTAPHADARHLADLTARANTILGQFHAGLIAPFSDQIAAATTILVVPHGNLHYVPFHALHDGRTYLAATHNVSYLPAASHLIAIRSRAEKTGTATAAPFAMLAIGHDCGGRLPNAIEEAREVARMWGGTTLLNSAATRASSIVASLWKIEDRCGSDFMRCFYSALRGGRTKGEALSATYREFMDGRVGGTDEAGSAREKYGDRYVHPYYWAPYMLIGDPGMLRSI